MISPGLTQPKNALRIIRGTSKTLLVSVEDEDGEVVNLTGCRAIFSAKRDVRDPHCVIQKDSDRGITQVNITLPREGKFEVYLTPEDTQTLDVATYIFDVWVILVSGKRYAVIPPSLFEVDAGVTVVT